MLDRVCRIEGRYALLILPPAFSVDADAGMAQPVSEFYRAFFPLLLEHGQIKRAMITSTASYSAPEDTCSAKWWFGIFCIKWFAGSAWNEINGMSRATVEELDLERVEWTLFR